VGRQKPNVPICALAFSAWHTTASAMSSGGFRTTHFQISTDEK